jgi:2-furoate---CoA ligase
MLIRDILVQAAERFPSREAVVEGDVRLTYAEFHERVLRLAGWLSDRGIRTGDRVCIGMGNSAEHVTVLMACQVLGAVAVPFNIRMKPASIGYIIRDSGARAIVLDDNVGLAETQEHSADVEDLVWIDAGTGLQRGDSLAYRHYLSRDPLATLPEFEESALSQIIYTSGTTGAPKGVAITHRATYQRLVTYVMSVGPTFDSGTKTLGAAPLYHTVGIHWVYLQTLFVNGTYYPVRKVTSETLAMMRSEGLTFMIGSPTLFKMMIALAGEEALPSMRYITYGSAAAEPELLEAMYSTFPNASISEFYGTTELSIPFITPSMREYRPGMLRPAGDFRVRIVRPHGDEDDVVEPGELGELIVHLGNAGVFETYWGSRGDEMKRAKCVGEWFRTGDGCRYDTDGHYYYNGRLDDMFISGGENIQPAEVENVINGSPGVADCAVFGVPDPTWGSVVTAFVVRTHAGIDEEALDQLCRESNLENYKRPRRFYFVDEIPRNPSGKIVRARIRDELMLHVPGTSDVQVG